MPSIKGTASISSNSALVKQLRSTTFPSNFSQKVNIAKVHRTVFTHWIEQRVEKILGFDDDIVSSTAVHLFLPSNDSSGDTATAATSAIAAAAAAADNWDVDPRRAQLDLAGFLGENEAAAFASELWTMMLDAQSSPSGIPRLLVEKKKEEMRIQREEQERKRKLQQQQDARLKGGEKGANHYAYHDDYSDNSKHNNNNNNMNAFVREAARRAEAARAAILPDARAGAAIGGESGVAAARGDQQPAAMSRGNSGPMPVPPSPSPQRYHGGGGRSGGGGDARGENNDYDRLRHSGGVGGFSNYNHRRNDGGRKKQ